jgi:phosphoglycolate phosphatase
MHGVLFDKDGTLIDFNATWLPLYRTAALRLADGDETGAENMLANTGYDPTSGSFASGSVLTVGTTDQMVAVWRPDLRGTALDDAIVQTDALFAAGAAEHVSPLADLETLFARLKSDGFYLGIATNDCTEAAEACFAHLELTATLDFITGYDGVERPKPAADMGLAFARSCGIDPAAMVVVGDNPHDLEMGMAAGAGFNVGVLSGTSSAQDFAHVADAVLGTVAELPEVLAARCGTAP